MNKNERNTKIQHRRPPTHGVACSEELWDRLRAHAATLDDRSANWVVVRALTEYLDAHAATGEGLTGSRGG